MSVLSADSVTRETLALMHGPARLGLGLGHEYVDFDGYVVALTPPGSWRMPNGVETAVQIEGGDRARIGEGGLRVGADLILPGEVWDPRPAPRVWLDVRPRFHPDPLALAGRGPGLTPARDDLLVGYAAGLALFCGASEQAARIARVAARRTTSLSATLLRHAALGELPEPAHALVERGASGPLLRFGRSTGGTMLLGLALGAATARTRPAPASLEPSEREAKVVVTFATRAFTVTIRIPSAAGSPFDAGRPEVPI